MSDQAPGVNRASFQEFHKQSGTYINFSIQRLYEQTGKSLTQASMYSKRGYAGQKYENFYRRQGLDSFAELLTLSIHLPEVKMHLWKLKKELKGFEDHHDLRNKIMSALIDKTPSTIILDKWFDAYSQALIYAGLIKVLSIKDDPTQKLWR